MWEVEVQRSQNFRGNWQEKREKLKLLLWKGRSKGTDFFLKCLRGVQFFKYIHIDTTLIKLKNTQKLLR